MGGAIGSAADLELTAADGNRLAARLARPAHPNGTGVVILPDLRGLHNFYRDLACRFAEAGIDALAIDYFGRSDSTGVRGNDFDHMTHLTQTMPATIELDVTAALEWGWWSTTAPRIRSSIDRTNSGKTPARTPGDRS